MGYRGPDQYAERDKLFGSSTGDRAKAKKSLDALFTPKAALDKCAEGHQWIRDFDRVTKCARCRTPKPAE